MRLLSLAESVKAYLKERPRLAEEYPRIPWDDIARFRDKIAHHYEGVDFELVWEILETDIPPLREALARLVAQESAQPRD